ncbi:phosphogluconate dehydrogenase (NAD(+)-dependent, decarboxylating) [Pedobacter sp. SYSU D00535]|uniref:phosphogluconate dehydrogenase (NAD(+)-dependent, decarboxylating) n=1 Tax=Pedobacter sp. SYSU D00535 TaxID=2810308 RepID=UPI001A973E44|nr:decarboxylating 6-phosphogluconate dehydrogenase [Pedobacter sp. SYSU D00535]
MIKGSIGIIGLGKMGGNLALQAVEKGYKVVGYDKLPNKDLLENEGIILTSSLEELVQQLTSPRIILIYVPAGKVVDILLGQLSELVQSGDILVDGGNSYWGDSIARHDRLKEKGVYFVDCGTSGGMDGARHGACFMVGGDAKAIEHVGPVLQNLAVENGFLHAGEPGSGHYVKLVHNGIEFGMLQAIGEGMDLLSNYKDPLNIPEILRVWNHGSVIRSWLVELMEKIYKQEDGFETVPAYIEDTGEVNWLVNDAMRMEVPVPVITQSVMQLFASRDKEQIWAKAIAMMRHGFGGHPFGEHEGIKHERQFGKIENAESSRLYKTGQRE